jgi:hypothetical protein
MQYAVLRVPCEPSEDVPVSSEIQQAWIPAYAGMTSGGGKGGFFQTTQGNALN